MVTDAHPSPRSESPSLLHLRVPALYGTLLASLALAGPAVAAPSDDKRKTPPAGTKKPAKAGVAKPG